MPLKRPRAALLLVSALGAGLFSILLAGCSPEVTPTLTPSAGHRPDTTITDATTANPLSPGDSSIDYINGLEAVLAGYALIVHGESIREFNIAREVTTLIVPERGYFEMFMSEGQDVEPAEMTITVRTPEKQLGYRAQVVFEGKPRELEMAYLFSPLTSPSGWRVLEMSQKGTQLSATLGRGTDPVIEEMTVEAEVDPQTGIITREEQKNQHGTRTITRRLVPIEDVSVGALDNVMAKARADWAAAFTRAENLNYPVFGLDLPALQPHRLQFGDGTVWLFYSTKAEPGRVAVEMWQVTGAEAERLPGRFPTTWTPGGETGSAHLRTFLLENRAVGVRVYDWVTKQGVASLDEIEAGLAPLGETVHAQVVEPAVLVFDEPMPLPSGADFGGLIAR